MALAWCYTLVGLVEGGGGLVEACEGEEGGCGENAPAFVYLCCRCCLVILVVEPWVVWCCVG